MIQYGYIEKKEREVMSSPFYAMLSRMKHIDRWALMRNTRRENLCEHSQDVAVIAHALAVLTNTRFGGQINVEKCVLMALYHDASEIITGDLPTPVKYDNPAIRDAYKQLETVACNKLISMLPEDLQPSYRPYFAEDHSKEARIVKAADKLAAVIKCVEELAQGNGEFASARRATESAVREMHLPAADCFLEEFLPAFSLTLDEQH